MSYQEYLAGKALINTADGFEPLWIPEAMRPDQAYLLDWSLRLGRAAQFADCGLGKTFGELAWAENVRRHTGKPVLIVTPLAVSYQTANEATKFGIDAAISRDGRPADAGITITNYDRLERFDTADYGGVVCDESSAIKAFDGSRRAIVTEFMRTHRYRLLGTATAAPNDYIELGTSSEALGYLGHVDMLGRFFTNKQKNIAQRGMHRTQGGSTDPGWRFKGHAEQEFWRWVASWARAVRKPSDLGFSDEGFDLPELIQRRHLVDARQTREGQLFDLPAKGLREEREEQRRTLTERCERAAELLSDAEHGIAWCNLNDESSLLADLTEGAVEVTGSQSVEEKEEKLGAFSRGEIRVLVSKARLSGFGLNWQHCHRMTFFPSHCYDDQTEVLTRQGWKSFEKVALDDDLATVHPTSLALEWQAPSRVIWEPYTGPMLRFAGTKSFDLMVTPNHRLFVQRCPTRYPSSDGSWSLRYAQDIADKFRRQEFRMLSAPQHASGLRPEFVDIPAFGRVNSRSRIVERIPAEDLMRLAGWYLSEGHCRPLGSPHGGRIVISQSDQHPEYRTEIIQLLTSLGLHVNSRTKDITTSSINLASYLMDQFGSGSYSKRIPRWVKDLHPDLLRVLRDTMMKGDGAASGYYYKSMSSRLRDDFQEVCLTTGIRAAVHNDYVSLAWQNLRPSVHRAPETVQYDGMIGCATVPNHTLIVRRNGIPVVSGNSYEQMYQAVRRCWRFGQKNPVTVDFVTTEGGLGVLANLERKAAQADEMFTSLVAHMQDAVNIERDVTYDTEVETPPWLAA